MVRTLIAAEETVTPADHGMLAWSFDPVAAINGQSHSSGALTFTRVTARASGTVNKIWFSVRTGGASLTGGQNLTGIYSTAGSKLGEATGLESIWNTAGLKSATLGAGVAITAGTKYYVSLLAVGGTPPLLSVAEATAGLVNINLTGANLRAQYLAAQTTQPSSVTMASNSELGWALWVGLSA